MSKTTDTILLIRQAQSGNTESLHRLAEIATPRLRSHVYRMTLQEDLTADIVQESILEMLRIIGKLKQADKFWPWLYGIATNKLHRHHRNERKHNGPRIEEIGFGGVSQEQQQGLENLLSQELRQIISRAMQGLKPRHRAILSMRCYEEMSYAEIAEVLNCNQFAAQMLFLRAKRALRKQLSKEGLGKGALMMVLVMFGKMTASSEVAAAQLTISAAATQVGLGAAVAATVLSKGAAVTVMTAGVIGTGVVMNHPSSDISNGATVIEPNIPIRTTAPIKTIKAEPDQSWYFFPDGPGGAVMLRQTVQDSAGREACVALQNELVNYHYDVRREILYQDNWRWYNEDLSVMQLPTDPPTFQTFLNQAQGLTGQPKPAQFLPMRRDGLLVIASHDARESDITQVARHENILEEEYFQFVWPAGTPVVDRRDKMHQRGWTTFNITGQVAGKDVSGYGQIPFLYAMKNRHPAWLQIHIGDLYLVDTPQWGYLRDETGSSLALSPGSLLRGLSRPWMGLHTIDMVRRDAALYQIPFSTRRIDEAIVEVILTEKDISLGYRIGLQSDLVEEITITGNGFEGQIEFHYHDEPRPDAVRIPYVSQSLDSQGELHTLWIMEVLQASMTK
ncbi:MAG: RNA polymerase sigma factor [Sedimentisphaerales bacterium]|nr:RNA polymerase sigma factor [Sedimentisphaerales bacterium]